MVEVGSMHITGTIDVSQIQRGMRMIEAGMGRAQNRTKSVQGDFTRLQVVTSRLSRVLLAAGTAAGGFITQAAREAPALAGSMASIGVSMTRAFIAFGEGAAPVFEFISTKLEGVASWAEAHPDMFAGVVGGTAVTAGVLAISKLAGISFASVTGFLSTLLAIVVSPAALSVLGAIAGLGAAAATGVTVGKGLANQFKVGQGTNIPLAELGGLGVSRQIQKAEPEELMYLQNKYADRVSGVGFGPERTAQIDFETGELYSFEHMQRDIIRNNQNQMSSLNITLDSRSLTMSQQDTFFS